MSFVRNLLGGILICAVATGVGVAQNMLRERPLKLFPTLPKAVAMVEQAQPLSNPGSRPSEAGNESLSSTPSLAASGLSSDELTSGEVSMQRLQDVLSGGAVVLIDARSPHEFEEGHLPGALNVPYESFVDHYDTLIEQVPMDAAVVVYCKSLTCDLSDQLATEMQLAGYQTVLLYKGGWEEWNEAGLPVETPAR